MTSPDPQQVPRENLQIDQNKVDYLKPIATRLLVLTAKGTWKAMKFLVKAAFHIPGMFRQKKKDKPVQTAHQNVSS